MKHHKIQTIVILILLLSTQNSYTADYPLYLRYIPYNPPNLHLQTARASDAYYLPDIGPGTTYFFKINPVLSSTLSLAKGSIPVRIQMYKGGPASCLGSKVLTLTLKYNISGAPVTVGSDTKSITLTSASAVLEILDFNITANQNYTLQSGDFVQLEVTHTASGSGDACIVNEFPLSGVDTDASKVTLQTGPILSVSKQKNLISDPFNNTTNPKSIPGAIVRYQINITNDATASAAGENIVFTDVIPTNTNYKSNTIKLNSTLLTDASGDDAGEYTGSTVTVDAGTINPGSTAVIEYDITVN